MLAFLRDTRALDSPGQHVHVAEEEGRIVAVSVGFTPQGEEASLGTILLEDPDRMDVFHKLMLAKVEHAVELGHERGSTTTRRRNLVEWGEKLTAYYRANAVTVRFHDVGEGCRRIELVDPRPDGAPRLGDA